MKILLATDGSPGSETAVEEVARRPFPTGSEVRVVAAVEPPTAFVSLYVPPQSYYEKIDKVTRERAREIVERAAEKIRAGAQSEGLKVSTEVLSGSPKQVLVDEAERWSADLIVVGSHGLTRWNRMLLGSVSQAVATHAPCSVEIVRCRTDEDKGDEK